MLDLEHASPLAAMPLGASLAIAVDPRAGADGGREWLDQAIEMLAK